MFLVVPSSKLRSAGPHMDVPERALPASVSGVAPAFSTAGWGVAPAAASTPPVAFESAAAAVALCASPP